MTRHRFDQDRDQRNRSDESDLMGPMSVADAIDGPRPLDPEARGQMEPLFGEDFSRVRVHEGSAQAQAKGAHAVTEGEDIHFAPGRYKPGSADGNFLLGHELTHVVQQRGGTPAQQAKANNERAGGNALEAEADAIGGRVAGGERVAGDIVGRASRGEAQAFGAGEHEEMGNEGAQRAGVGKVTLTDGYALDFGQITALNGDHFESIDQMRQFAANDTGGAESRDEIEYALEWKLGVKSAVYKNKGAAKAAQERRYYQLAGKNDTHFPNPEEGDIDRTTAEKAKDWKVVMEGMSVSAAPSNAVAAYRSVHVKALGEAAALGAMKLDVDPALAADAAASHFLTDSFAAGHLRTERTDIRKHWDDKVPMFYYNLKGFMAEEVALQMAHDGSELPGPFGLPLPVDADQVPTGLVNAGVLEKVSAALDSMTVVNFGDVVALAVHDYDNKIGIKAESGGSDVTLKGDDHVGEGGSNEKTLAAEGVMLSIQEVQEAFALGQAGKIEEATAIPAKLLGNDDLYDAERLIPNVTSDANLTGKDRTKPEGNTDIDWKFPDIDTLFAQQPFQDGIVAFAEAKAGEVKTVGEKFDEGPRAALEKAVVEPLKNDSVQSVRRVIDWTPTFASAASYVREAKNTPGGMESLSITQRENLIASALAMSVPDASTILDVLDAAPEADATQIIVSIGWNEIAHAFYDQFGQFSMGFVGKYPPGKYGGDLDEVEQQMPPDAQKKPY